MTHSDDVGFVCPPLLAPVQVVIVPIWRKDSDRASVLEVGAQIANELRAAGHRVKLDDRDDLKPGAKYYEWEGRGVPVRLEIGPRDVERNQVVVAVRTGGKNAMKLDGLSDSVRSTLVDIQRNLFERAYARQEANSHRGLGRSAFVDLMNDAGGFVYGGFCGDQKCERDDHSGDCRVTAYESLGLLEPLRRLLPAEAGRIHELRKGLPAEPGETCRCCGGRIRRVVARRIRI